MENSLFWNRFKHNKLSIAGAIFILLSFFIALLGYLITPDSTPFSNNQMLSIAAKPPMFKAKIALIRKHQNIESSSFFHTMLLGRETQYQCIPIDSFKIQGDSLILNEYSSGKGDEPFESRFHLVDVVFPVDKSVPVVKTTKDNFRFKDAEGRIITISKAELIKTIVDKQIVTRTFLLGTDRFGRDMFSRLIIGTRVSFSVGFISVFISLIIGIWLGVVAGYYRDRTDVFISWLINVVWSIPTLLMVLSITLVLGKGFWQVFVAVGLTMWVEVARVVRGQVLSFREKEFVEAARALGFGDFRIIFRHILPNIIGPVVIISAANFASAILMEAGLSFLGVGVQPPVPSWGNMIKDHYGYIILDQAYLAILPGFAIMLMVLAFNFLGNGLRDGFDTKME
ncbi:MAG: ABC transporter permease [Bacteroidota bacterium]|nr:ABC transporter permease [Bacteroidota bacterium]